MRLRLLLLVALSAISLAQPQASEFIDFVRGIGVGLHFERLAPSILPCGETIAYMTRAFAEAIIAYNEHQPFYNFMNNVTFALGTVPRACRKCIVVPTDIWRNLDEKYFKKFNYSWIAYFQAVFLNFGFKMDEILYNILKVKSYWEKHDFYMAGYHSGYTVNVVLNVTTEKPIPPPPPVDDDYWAMEEPGVSTNWTDIHVKFRMYYNYSMITLNYTHWINGTTFKNLNSSVMNIEMKVYTALMKLNNSTPENIIEAVLLAIDTMEYLNPLFNGLYFLVQQVPERILKDSIFEHITYAPLNLLLHLGYFVYDGIKLYSDFNAQNYNDMCRRAAIIFRKILYFDEDTLDEIRNGVSIHEI